MPKEFKFFFLSAHVLKMSAVLYLVRKFQLLLPAVSITPYLHLPISRGGTQAPSPARHGGTFVFPGCSATSAPPRLGGGLLLLGPLVLFFLSGGVPQPFLCVLRHAPCRNRSGTCNTTTHGIPTGIPTVLRILPHLNNFSGSLYIAASALGL